MQRRKFIIGLISSWVAFLYSTVSRADDLWLLVTKEEFDREIAFQKVAAEATQKWSAAPPPPRTTVGGPIISVRQPDQSKPIQPPVTIRIAFRAEPGATIDVKSFRAMYGSMKFDITQRLLDHAKLDASGLSANNAQLPAGQHIVTLAIGDSLHRIGTLTIRFTVV